MKLVVVLRYCACLLISATPLAALSADPVLAETEKLSVTSTDIEGDALRIPVERRKETLTQPESVQQLANNLIVRRSFAAQAEAAKLADDPVVQAAIRIARERVLSDALFARMDAANKPAAPVIDALALATYKSNPTRFQGPAEASARHILIKLDTPDAKAKATAILAELKAGADFAALAKAKSQDPGSATAGGSLGYFPAGRMVAPFQEAVDKLQKPGDLSDVVESQFGFHVIQLEGRRPAGVRPFDEVKSILRREAEVKIINDARLAQVQRIQDTVKFNKSAIEAFAQTKK